MIFTTSPYLHFHADHFVHADQFVHASSAQGPSNGELTCSWLRLVCSILGCRRNELRHARFLHHSSDRSITVVRSCTTEGLRRPLVFITKPITLFIALRGLLNVSTIHQDAVSSTACTMQISCRSCQRSANVGFAAF